MNLPSELVMAIFHSLCENQHPRNNVRYLGISRDVRKWVEPSLYRVVMWTSGYFVHGYPPPLTSSGGEAKPTVAFLRNVYYTRSVLLQGVPMRDVHSILPLCTNCVDLGLWVIDDPNTSILELIRHKLPSLRHFSGNIEEISAPVEPSWAEDDEIEAQPSSSVSATKFVFDSTPFPSLSRLYLIGITEATGGRLSPHWESLAMLPNLTHLSIEGDYTSDFVVDVLRHCTSLHVLVLFGLKSKIPVPGKNPKIVRISSVDTRTLSVIHVWEREQRGGRLNIWDMAQRLIEVRTEGSEDDSQAVKWEFEDEDEQYFKKLDYIPPGRAF